MANTETQIGALFEREYRLQYKSYERNIPSGALKGASLRYALSLVYFQ